MLTTQSKRDDVLGVRKKIDRMKPLFIQWGMPLKCQFPTVMNAIGDYQKANIRTGRFPVAWQLLRLLINSGSDAQHRVSIHPPNTIHHTEPVGPEPFCNTYLQSRKQFRVYSNDGTVADRLRYKISFNEGRNDFGHVLDA